MAFVLVVRRAFGLDVSLDRACDGLVRAASLVLVDHRRALASRGSGSDTVQMAQLTRKARLALGALLRAWQVFPA